MTLTASVEEARLSEEITDLKSSLADVPAVVRQQGLFDSYESRLRSLQEQLLSLRLERLVEKYGDAASPAGIELPRGNGVSPAADVVSMARAAETVEKIRQRRHRRTTGYRYPSIAAAGATLVAGVLLASDTVNLWRLGLEQVGAVLMIAATSQILIRLIEELRADAEHRLELLRNQLELLLAIRKADRSAEPRLYERTLELLDETRIER